MDCFDHSDRPEGPSPPRKSSEFSREGPRVRIRLPPALGLLRTRVPGTGTSSPNGSEWALPCEARHLGRSGARGQGLLRGRVAQPLARTAVIWNKAVEHRCCPDSKSGANSKSGSQSRLNCVAARLSGPEHCSKTGRMAGNSQTCRLLCLCLALSSSCW